MSSSKKEGRTAVVNRVCEFFVVATHAILYIQEVYPQRIFEMRQKYGVATFYSSHPEVNNHIAKVVSSLQPWLLEDLIQSVTIAVFSAKTQKVQARYVFDVKVLAAEEDVTTTSLSSLDNQLRANLCRLLSCGSVAADPGRDRESEKEDGELSFEFIVRTKGVRTGVQWMPADGKERREFQGGGVAMPLKDADCFATTLQLSSRVEFEATEWPHS